MVTLALLLFVLGRRCNNSGGESNDWARGVIAEDGTTQIFCEGNWGPGIDPIPFKNVLYKRSY